MASNSTGLLPGQSPPISIITATDQSGVVLIVTALALTIALISLFIRGYMQLQIRRQYLLDDFVVAGATLFALFQSVAVFFEVSNGFGKTMADISPIHLQRLQKAAYASELLYILTLWLTKCSVAFLLLRLSPQRGHNMVSYAILGASTLFMAASIFMVAIRCDPLAPWIFIKTRCTNLFVRWEVETAFDIITEFALFGASIYLVKSLQLSASKKFAVVFAFGLRLAVVAPAILRLYYLDQEFASSDSTLHGVLASVFTQIQLGYAIIAATIPCLRPFMAALNTHYGSPATLTSPSGSKGQYTTSYNLTSLRSAGSRFGGSQLDRSQFPTPRVPWDQTNHQASVVSGDRHSIESQGSKRMIISKNTEWHVDFEGTSAKGAESGSSRR